MKRASGFSLVELVVIIVILAILAAIAIPLFSDSQIKANWYQEEVRAGMRYAQRQAVAQRRNVYVIVQANQVELCYADPCGARLTKLSDGQNYILAAPSGVVLAPQTFHFNALGQPSGPVSLPVGAATITVAAETGYVQ